MVSFKPILKSLLKQLCVLFLFYEISRLLFYAFNYSSFQDLKFVELISICFYGLRFDSFSIAASNSLYIILFCLPFVFHYNKYYRIGLKILLVISNALPLSLNFIDIAYFPFTQKRTTYDVSGLVFGGQTDFLKLIPHFLADYWYLILLYLVCVYLLYRWISNIYKKEFIEKQSVSIKSISLSTLTYAVILSLILLGIRGGLQRIPIVLLDAAAYTSPKYISILINTPFTFLKSMELNETKKIEYYDSKTLASIYSPIHPADTGAFKNVNVCVIILESFSKEYTGLSHLKSYTPFLDSLMSVSTVYTNGLANAKSSIDGVPAILSGLPTFLEDKYLNSRYSNNEVESLPTLLKSKGYYSAFFHGGTNGTMNFDSYAKMADFDLYFGRNEYNNDKDYDGQWGIFDEPFFKEMIKQVNTFKEPFLVSVFTLSSHNPYTIPDQHKNKFPKGTLKIHESIGYADYALKQFFEEAKKQSWFKNTLFVLSADHTGVSENQYYSTNLGKQTIPIITYFPGQKPEKVNYPVQQIDILPTVLDYVNYDKPYYNMGRSMLNHSSQPIIYYISPNYSCVKDSFYYEVIDGKLVYKTNYQTDSLLTQNKLDINKDLGTQEFFRAYIQTYTNDLISNNTHYNATK
jgi:phosphoglycerol transferase MdoB-like AlkP superfamily enzyme